MFLLPVATFGGTQAEVVIATVAFIALVMMSIYFGVRHQSIIAVQRRIGPLVEEGSPYSAYSFWVGFGAVIIGILGFIGLALDILILVLVIIGAKLGDWKTAKEAAEKAAQA